MSFSTKVQQLIRRIEESLGAHFVVYLQQDLPGAAGVFPPRGVLARFVPTCPNQFGDVQHSFCEQENNSAASDSTRMNLILHGYLPTPNLNAPVLSGMEAALTAQEPRRDKTRALKQGMMQELLTGRIRLV